MLASCTEIRSNVACRDRAQIYYLGVRLFGQEAWDNYSVVIRME